MRFLAILACLALAACKPATPVVEAASGGLPFASVHELRLDGKVLLAQLAVTETERTQGFTGVSPQEDRGMLFVYPLPARGRFWMKDTPSDLDIAFLDREGRILQISQMRALDTEATVSESDKVKFALEMRRGWFAEAGIRPGAKLDLYSVVNALRARGFNPTRLGI
ncbi:MAG: DUF192 domain-containing protein [Opitutia bacterium]